MDPVEITAGRLHLRPWTPYDAEVLFRGCNDPVIQRWTRVPAPYTRELAAARVVDTERAWAVGTELSWAVCDSTSGEVLAAIDLRHMSDDTWDVGYLCYAWARGQGVVPAAFRAVAEWAFANVGASRVEWRAIVGNHASRRAAQKAGVVLEGVLRGRHAIREGRHDDTWVGALVPGDPLVDTRPGSALEPVEIAAGRLQLRPWTSYDRDALIRGHNDPDVRRWTGTQVPFTDQDAAAYLAKDALAWADGTAAVWAAHDATTGDVVGCVGLYGIGDGGAMLGYWCLPEARGTGAATEMAAAAARFGFGALGLERLGWACNTGNTASRAVAQKLGFTVEGVARKAFVQRGTRVDDWFGSLLATDPMTDTRPLPAPPTLSDGVVTLRPWSLADAEDCTLACNDPDTARWLPVPTPYTVTDAEDYISGYIAGSWVDGTAAELAVTDATTGELLGAMGLKLHQRRLGFGEIGYWTAPWARGRGVAGRGATLSARWGLEVLGLHRVELLADVENLPSQRAAEKGGFVREGVLRNARFLRDGQARDMVVFSLVAADLAAAAPPG